MDKQAKTEKVQNHPFQKSTVIVSLFIVAIFGVASLVAYNFWDRMIADTIRSNDIKAGLIAKVILEHEKATIGMLRSFAARPLLIKAIKDRDVNETFRHFKNILKDNPEIEVMSAADPSGTLWINDPTSKASWNKNFAFRDWYKGVSKEWKPYVSGVYKRAAHGKGLAVSVCVPVFDENRKVIGILNALQTTAFFQKVLNEIGLDVDSKITLIDEEGQIIYSDRFPHEKEVLKYTSFPFVEKALAGQKGSAEIRDYTEGEKTKYVSFAPVEGQGWSVIVEKARGDIFASAYDGFVVIAVISCLAGVVVLISGSHFRQRQRQISRLAQLSQELNIRVKERTAELETANEELEKEIGQRQQAEESLRKSETRLRLAFDAGAMGTWDWDLDTGEMFWNERHYLTFGYQPGEFKPNYEAWAKRIHPEDLASVEALLRQKLQEGGEYSAEYKVVWPDGTEHWVEANGRFQCTAAGKAIRSYGVIADITQRKRVETRLAADLAALTRLHELSGKLLEGGGIQPLLQEIMDAAVAIAGAGQGTLQLLENNSLRLVAHHGHQQPFLDFFASAENRAPVCGEGTKRGERVVVPDVEENPLFEGTPSLSVLRQAGVRAVQSRPLLSRKGALLGILTTQWGTPYTPNEHDLWRIDLLARQASDLIEQARAEEKLRESEERYRGVVQNTSAVILRVDPQGIICFANQRALEFFGYSEDELIGKHAVGTIVPERETTGRDLAAMVDEISQDPDRFHSNANENMLKNGERVWMEWTNSGIYDEQGRLKEFLSVGIDATERKRAAEKLRKSEERLNRAQEIAHLGSWELDLRENKLFWSDEVFRIFGLEPQEFSATYESFLESVHPDDRTAVDAAYLDSVREGREAYEIEHRVIRKSTGEIRIVHERCEHIRDQSGRIIRSMGMVHDITERKRMEEELRRSRDELELRVQERTAEIKQQAELLELSHDSIVVRDLENRILFWNRGAAEVYGWKTDEALGKVSHELLETEYPVSLEEQVAELLEKGRWEGELVHTRKDGRRITVLSRHALQRDEHGRPSVILAINVDITDRKRMEEQLRQAQRMEALGTLAGGIAHDFNNLLTPILLNTELALLDVESKVLPAAESLRLVQEGANRGKELVKQIIVFSRHKGQTRDPVEISLLIIEGLKLLKSTALKAIEIRTQMEAGNIVLADPVQLHQVVMNLCLNAANAMAGKDGILEVSLAKVEAFQDPAAAQLMGLKPGPYVQLTVKDNGHGMPPEVREKAFDPFFTTKQKGEGSGMGLAVVHGIVKKHEGAIRLESEEGEGTAVNIFLPVFQGDTKGSVPSAPVEIPQGNERILFVDDEESQVVTVRPLLERLGYRVTVEMDPRKALERFRSQPGAFDLVIMDQIMPYLPGNRLAQELLGIRPDIPIILCTGFSETVDEEKARAVGIREFILKPFTMKEISELIRRALSKTVVPVAEIK